MYRIKVLKNGLKVITSSMPHMESVAIGLWIGVGGRYENKMSCGISHLIEHMVFKGTVSRTANMLKEAIEGVGGSFNAFTGEEETCYFVKLPSDYAGRGLDILSDMALNPKFDAEELEKEKRVICEEIKMYMDQPAHRVFDILGHSMWPDHPLGRPITGYIDTVKNFTRNDLINFTRRYYRPANMSIAACGRIKRGSILGAVESIFRMGPEKGRFTYARVKKTDKGKNADFFHKSTEQTHVVFGFHSINRTHELRYALALLNIILGGNMSSRLFDRLREKMALCYDISSSLRKYAETGAFTIHAGIDNNRILDASREIVREIKKMKEQYVTEDELCRAKEYARGQLRLVMEDTAARMMWLGEKILLEGTPPRVKEIFKNIEKVTPGDLKKAAGIVFRKENMSFATVGPTGANVKKKLKKVLEL